MGTVDCKKPDYVASLSGGHRHLLFSASDQSSPTATKVGANTDFGSDCTRLFYFSTLQEKKGLAMQDCSRTQTGNETF